MTTTGYAARHLSRTFLIAFGLAVAFLAGDAANSPSSAQKAQFERTKPHVNVGTIGHVENNNFATPGPAQQDIGNLIVDGVRDILFAAPPAVSKRVRRHTFRRKFGRQAALNRGR